MPRYLIVAQDGRIAGIATCPPEQAEIQAGPGETVIESDVGSITGHHVVDGQVVAYTQDELIANAQPTWIDPFTPGS
jgi:uncharacterized membrane protein (UPF0127 family)